MLCSKKVYNVLIVGTTFSINGGVQNYIFNLVANLNLNGFKITYFAEDVDSNEQSFKDDLIALGIDCIGLPHNKPGSLRLFSDYLKHNKNKFSIIHINLTSGRFLAFGMLSKLITKAKVIFHSHTFIPKNKLNIREKAIQVLYSNVGDAFLACSVPAGEYMFGKKTVQSKRFMVAKNCISKDRFYTNSDARRQLRLQYELGDNMVFGYVGRFNQEKNVKLVIHIFRHILSQRPDAFLVLVGGGSEIDNIKGLVESQKISKQVIFAGIKENIQDFMNTFDLLILPSKFESLGIVLIEAQACGLNCLVSSGVLPDSNITPLWHQMRAGSTISEWAKNAMRYASSEHLDYWSEIEKAGYSIKSAVKAVQVFYIQTIGDDKENIIRG